MSGPLAELSPRSLWDHFATICSIPRPSKHEVKIVAWIRGLAAEHGFAIREDAAGNLVVDIPATARREGAPVVILQTHLDMVGEKNKDVRHDFLTDSIRPRVDGEWVRANGTTLGADNGIGVAAALAVATDPSVDHGPLELLFTLDEETGLTGALHLDGSMLRGRTLLNLDSEEDGVLFVGCAGGADSHLHLEVASAAAPPEARPWRLEVTGLRGGHSGMSIHEGRGNALKLVVRALRAMIDAGAALELVGLWGGSKHNAIPREAEALVYVPERDDKKCAAALASALEEFRSELAGVDDGLVLGHAPAEHSGPVLAPADRERLLDLLEVLPHGVLGMSRDVPGLVETSSCLAAVSEDNGTIKIVTSTRSSVASTLRGVLGSIRAAARLAGARAETHDGYPGWAPNMNSSLLEITRRVYAEIWGRDPRVTGVHAGLECGLLAEKVAGLDMVSFGPRIEGAHSPDERVHIASVERFWRALAGVLDALAPVSR